MTKPDDIPQDVWDAAVAEVTGDDTRLSLVVISRAILAERERCAKVADAERDRHWLNYQNGGHNLDLFYTTAAENVGAAIRKGAQ